MLKLELNAITVSSRNLPWYQFVYSLVMTKNMFMVSNYKSKSYNTFKLQIGFDTNSLMASKNPSKPCNTF